jgi:hypothetical protein
MNLNSINVSDAKAVLSALPAIIAAMPGGKALKAAAYAAEAHLEETNPVEVHFGPVHIHFDQLPVELRRGVLPLIFGPPDDDAPAVSDAAASLIKLASAQ